MGSSRVAVQYLKPHRESRSVFSLPQSTQHPIWLLEPSERECTGVGHLSDPWASSLTHGPPVNIKAASAASRQPKSLELSPSQAQPGSQTPPLQEKNLGIDLNEVKDLGYNRILKVAFGRRRGLDQGSGESSVPLRAGSLATASLVAAAVGGAAALGAAPFLLGAMGFTATGIAASSLTAKMMSAAAIANGGGIAAGSVVATLQSVDK
ncbi:interferon alpha-inducible protein 27-like protein 2 [Fukomys damarensis]|nr:interferon alpha-inducible protein 27-like protein 2 [Fukomys damarensis]